MQCVRCVLFENSFPFFCLSCQIDIDEVVSDANDSSICRATLKKLPNHFPGSKLKYENQLRLPNLEG